MILLAKIVGFALILLGAVSFLGVIPTYRAFKSEETRFFLTPNDSNSPNEINEKDLPKSSVLINGVKFFKTFFLPSVLILILGIAVVAVAFRLGTPGGMPSNKG